MPRFISCPQHLDELRTPQGRTDRQDQGRRAGPADQGNQLLGPPGRPLKDQELAGRVNAKLNSGLARQRADELTAGLQKRLTELEQERKLSRTAAGRARRRDDRSRRLAPKASRRSSRRRRPTFAIDTEAIRTAGDGSRHGRRAPARLRAPRRERPESRLRRRIVDPRHRACCGSSKSKAASREPRPSPSPRTKFSPASTSPTSSFWPSSSSIRRTRPCSVCPHALREGARLQGDQRQLRPGRIAGPGPGAGMSTATLPSPILVSPPTGRSNLPIVELKRE